MIKISVQFQMVTSYIVMPASKKKEEMEAVSVPDSNIIGERRSSSSSLSSTLSSSSGVSTGKIITKFPRRAFRHGRNFWNICFKRRNRAYQKSTKTLTKSLPKCCGYWRHAVHDLPKGKICKNSAQKSVL